MRKPRREEVQRILDAAVKRLIEHLDVEKIVLFGSFIKGTYTKDSDIDLLVMLNTEKKGVERYAMVSELLEPRKMPMDIIVRTPAEMKKRENFFDPFMANVLSGKILYEKKT